jgi:peroxiredoxin
MMSHHLTKGTQFMRRSTLLPIATTCLILFAGGRAFAGPQDDATATRPDFDPKAEAILKAMDEFYRELDEGGGKIDVAIRLSQGGEEIKVDSSSVVAFRRPNLIAIRTVAPSEGGATVNDGDHLYLSASQSGKYIQADPIESFGRLADHMPEIATMSDTGGAEFDVLISLLGEDPYKRMTETIEGLEYVGEETIDKKKLHRLRVTEDEVDLDMWVLAGDEPWLYRLKPDLAGLFRLMYGEEAASEAPEMVVDFHGWSGAPPAADAFAFEPPREAKKVDTFLATGMGEERALKLIGTEAPAFDLEQLDGGMLKLIDHRGRDIVILDFWATWCAPCIQSMPALIEVAGQYADKGVAFIAVNVGEDKEKIQAMMSDRNWSFNVALDAEGEVSTLYQAQFLPTTFIIDAKGIIRNVHVGSLPNLEAVLTAELDALLAEEKSGGQ